MLVDKNYQSGKSFSLNDIHQDARDSRLHHWNVFEQAEEKRLFSVELNKNNQTAASSREKKEIEVNYPIWFNVEVNAIEDDVDSE